MHRMNPQFVTPVFSTTSFGKMRDGKEVWQRGTLKAFDGEDNLLSTFR